MTPSDMCPRCGGPPRDAFRGMSPYCSIRCSAKRSGLIPAVHESWPWRRAWERRLVKAHELGATRHGLELLADRYAWDELDKFDARERMFDWQRDGA